ncbi:hypothetical protein HK104_001179 [Borealophlyctis nickersoniae]|nr:hypothetical protein HK104_001179 [Borealophlyctis nickersoniae]
MVSRLFSYLAAGVLLLTTTANAVENDLHDDSLIQQFLGDDLPIEKPNQSSLWGGPSLRVAIIGAGAAGASTSYFLRKLEQSTQPSWHKTPIHTVIYDRGDRIGGRARTVTLNLTICENAKCEPQIMNVELGASIFAEKNFHLVNASREFNLTLNDLTADDGQPDRLGVWDGEKWTFRQTGRIGRLPGTDGWLGGVADKARLLARYGLWHGPIQAVALARQVAAQFLNIYDRIVSGHSFTRVDNVVRELGLWDTVSKPALEWFRDDKKINQLFVEEFVGGILMNTYLQQIWQSHAFAGLISLYSGTNNLYNVRGGNYQIFERMLDGEDVRLKTDVLGVERVEKDGKTRYIVTTKKGAKDTFDVVVMAAPLPASEITFRNIPLSRFPTMKYVHLHVTLVFGTLNPTYFNLPTASSIPETLFIPSPPTPNTYPSVPFYSMGKHQLNATHVLVKFFSSRRLEADVLDEMFVTRGETHRHVWDAPGSYPYLTPKQGADGAEEWEAPIQITPGLYYVNAMEGWISTMETQTVAGRNVANLVWSGLEERVRRGVERVAD